MSFFAFDTEAKKIKHKTCDGLVTKKTEGYIIMNNLEFNLASDSWKEFGVPAVKDEDII